MGLRALIGTERADGSYEARHVHYDAVPTVIVPALSALVHDELHHDLPAAVERLMQTDWRRIYALPGCRQMIGIPLDEPGERLTGQVDATAADDREWAYLFGGHRLHVYLGVPTAPFVRKWEPWACWSVDELPLVPLTELLDVQRSGNRRQWLAGDRLKFETAAGCCDLKEAR
ncbi:hypothetical protein GA0070610_1756 [Micromonospora echinofusca]|uniref:Uncharacterized protein n=1 Tax=Micromonospora echinofusca TaxID=47858 RepID=A0A1C5G7H7_MICEH|nr:hypothetical protein [Micromonospora echinofusca]SCG15522.1 hypothetical protein GA0070610_1756 [Micromonospora echinofusca]